MPQSSIQSFYDGLQESDRDLVLLARDDGVVLAQFPSVAAPIGQRLGADSLRMRLISKAGENPPTVSGQAADGIARLYQAQRVAGYPVRVLYGLDYGEVRRLWLDQLVPFATLALLSSLLLYLLTARLARSVAAAEAAEAEARAQQALTSFTRTSAAALQESEKRYRSLLKLMPAAMYTCDKNGRILLFNDQAAAIWGRSPAPGESEVKFCGSFRLSRLDGTPIAHDETPIATCLKDGTAFRGQEVIVERPDGSKVVVSANADPIRDEAGKVTGAVNVFLDVTDRKRGEDRQQTLMKELAHRGKNLLAVIHAIAARSVTRAASADDAWEALEGRLIALSRTYGTLTDEAFEGAALEEIIASALEAFSGRISTDGPRVMLKAKVAQTFSLVVHEHCTNAVKYGALSVPDGRAEVRWWISGARDQRRLEFEWEEMGGPPARALEHAGFGTAILTSAAAAEFAYKPELHYDEGGFRYRFNAPLDHMGSAVGLTAVRERLESEFLVAFYDTWARGCGADGDLPVFDEFDREHFAASGGLTIATVSEQGTVNLIEVGEELCNRLGTSPVGSDLADGEVHSLSEAYRRCARSRLPGYELFKIDLGDGDPVRFERLLLPYSARGSQRATHVAGICSFS